MGLIRLLLAFSVLSNHFKSSHYLKFVGGDIAVELFFIISGFYMAMVYKDYSSNLYFWKSRYLRLYPVYIFCAASALILFPLDRFIDGINALPFFAKTYLIFTNCTLLFQDLTMFLGVNNGVTFFTKNFSNSNPPLHTLLLVPPAWSLGLEISFYLICPFIIKLKSYKILIIAIVSIVIKLILSHQGYNADPWSYRFFPSELSLFIFGIISYRLYYSVGYLYFNKFISIIIFILVVFILYNYQNFNINYNINKWMLYIVFILSLGFIFNLTKYNRFDRFISILSYPIYCVHIIVLTYLMPIGEIWKNDGSVLMSLLYFLVTCIVSIIIYYVIEKPFDAYRKKYKYKMDPILNVN